MIHDKTIRVGACGWDHDHWLENFYPEDLPADWRLSYYANEFSVVLVPEIIWRSADASMGQWAEDVPDDFLFYFLTSTQQVSDEQIRHYLGVKFGGFVYPDVKATTALVLFEAKSLREWRVWLQETECKAVFLMDEHLSSKQLSDFQSLIELMGL